MLIVHTREHLPPLLDFGGVDWCQSLFLGALLVGEGAKLCTPENTSAAIGAESRFTPQGRCVMCARKVSNFFDSTSDR